ncbi:MAG: response regulator [Timaviella obliquedivisa GSE-PSE-MK23-08B]|jgi:DNA-binding response OmpR family regulator|nr:response regulator [Timaviella obliquedivisa GSE-PSE-MK23-08B]
MYRVLIAEDELRIVAFLEKGLRQNGFETTVVTRGQDAIDQSQQGTFDLLLLDLGLPGKDGWTVIDELRKSGQTLPIVIVTAREGETNRAESLRRGANDYITKPFRFQELLAKVNFQLGQEKT